MTHFKRPCKHCGKYFIPTGKGWWVCEKCIKRKYKENGLKRRNKKNKKGRIKKSAN